MVPRLESFKVDLWDTWIPALVLIALLMPAASPRVRAAETSATFTLVIHGGAGVMRRSELTPEKEAACRAGLEEALRAGHTVLRTNGTSLDAVMAAIRVLEDSPWFNAGRGAVLNAEGVVEMDAAIMDGASLKAGTVTGLKHIKNPIELARGVMDRSPHVMMAGEGAEAFARELKLEFRPQEYFITPERKRQLEKARQLERDAPKSKSRSLFEAPPGNLRFGTVGAVALDRHGNLAAATSTGGMTNKRYGRIGDSPIIGAGTYANNNTCAVSATGHGEYFIRAVVAHDIAALMEYRGLSVREAAETVVHRKLKEMGGQGGVIALDRRGNFTMPFNTDGMYRGVIRAEGRPEVGIFKD
jgi:beta-aspartyl-peptidase (threonine type)